MWEDNQSSRANRVERTYGTRHRRSSYNSYNSYNTYDNGRRYVRGSGGGILGSVGTVLVIILIIYMLVTGQLKDVFSGSSSNSLYNDANRQLRETGDVVFIDRTHFAMFSEQFDYFVNSVRQYPDITDFTDSGNTVTFSFRADGKKYKYVANYDRSNNILHVWSKDRGSYDVDISLTGKFLGFLR